MPEAPSPRRALITGITGQDGSYLAELLLAKGYEVHGFVRRTSVLTRARIEHLYHGPEHEPSRLHLHYGDVSDLPSVVRVVEHVQPHEVYNLAAQSHVRISFDMPDYTLEVTGRGAFNVLEAARRACPTARVYQAGSSEMFGLAEACPQDERTPFHPRSPYGIAKVLGHHTAVLYREAHGMFVANGILFNHESPRRGANFVTRKIAIGAARIAAGLQDELALGNLAARRDWGWAPEYVEAMWRMLQHDTPDDFVIATGETHSVEEFLGAAFAMVGLDWHDYVRHDDHLERPAEVPLLCGDARKARDALGWEPTVTFEELVRKMVDAERTALAQGGTVI
ncbi:MAG: GDP-mannose 4,6-dehydratase [Dehalococcoidia bacterium]